MPSRSSKTGRSRPTAASPRFVPSRLARHSCNWLAGSLAKGQKITAYVHDRVELSKQYHAYSASTFPTQQAIPTEVRKNFLQDSPGIETRSKAVTTLAAELTAGIEHPWEQAQAFFAGVRGNIEPQIGPYTSVATALETRRGDCEEMAGVFVALCRSVNIPARLCGCRTTLGPSSI